MKQAARSKMAYMSNIIRIYTRREANSMEDIYKVAVICFARGIFSKMLDDMIDIIKEKCQGNYKRKQKEVSIFCHKDFLGINLNKIVKISTEIMRGFNFYVKDEDVADICLVVDHFIMNKISDFSFLSTSMFFSVIIDESPGKTNEFKELDFIINETNFHISEEKKAYKIKKAQERAAALGEECFYDEDVYKAYEESELSKGKAMGELFIKIFSDNEYFRKIANKHREKIGEEEYNLLLVDMKKQVERANEDGK